MARAMTRFLTRALFCISLSGAVRAGELDAFPETGPPPIALPHFPRPLDAFVFRNWGAVPAERIALALGVAVDDVRQLAGVLGLGAQPEFSEDLLRRTSITIIRRNWHLLPYRQLLLLLGWDEAKLAFHLREDDFLWIKLGSLKPACAPLRFEPTPDALKPRLEALRATITEVLGGDGVRGFRPRLSFIE